MVNYNLTIQSTPTGIEMSVQALGQVQWIVTNKTLTFASGTVINVVAPNTVGEPEATEELGWKFIKWENDSTDRKRTVTLSADTTIIATYEQQKYYPTRHYSKRQDKYFGKVDSEVYGLRTTALKPMMVDQMTTITAQQAELERKVGNYLHAQGLYGIEIHHYRNYSQELYALTRLFKDATLNAEAQLKHDKWETRGLNSTHLINIAKLLGITVT